ncbi:PREDICTED: basic salivary proline-rich protein 4-like [Chinchilla lanigera]|uniref:basic salivary proline-rich protein 4-like n=1 Tax=Chinchilla lanigera TaxID=34839 RepID=UPI000697B94A|nr:PREDICTED: basic salivary proline-rich protein 4-like [Chinchilla lanigera]
MLTAGVCRARPPRAWQRKPRGELPPGSGQLRDGAAPAGGRHLDPRRARLGRSPGPGPRGAVPQPPTPAGLHPARPGGGALCLPSSHPLDEAGSAAPRNIVCTSPKGSAQR